MIRCDKFVILSFFISLLTCSFLQSFENSYGFHQIQGRRQQMEDVLCVKFARDHSFFAVFDGHGGKEVADYLSENLYNQIISSKYFSLEKYYEAIREAHLKTNKDLFKTDIESDGQGSTAVSALIMDKKIYVANVGDSRAVLSAWGLAIPMSQDQKPDREDEKKRIEKLGGKIEHEGCWRVLNEDESIGLAVSRAFGDKMLSKFIISDPELQRTHITKDFDFLILACDGIWDVLSNQEAVDVVCASLKIKKDYNLAAKKLVDEAFYKESTDNLSVIVIGLN